MEGEKIPYSLKPILTTDLKYTGFFLGSLQVLWFALLFTCFELFSHCCLNFEWYGFWSDNFTLKNNTQLKPIFWIILKTYQFHNSTDRTNCSWIVFLERIRSMSCTKCVPILLFENCIWKNVVSDRLRSMKLRKRIEIRTPNIWTMTKINSLSFCMKKPIPQRETRT